jgi:hypothetical protein
VLTYHAATAPKALTVPERESPEGAVAVCAIAIALGATPYPPERSTTKRAPRSESRRASREGASSRSRRLQQSRRSRPDAGVPERVPRGKVEKGARSADLVLCFGRAESVRVHVGDHHSGCSRKIWNLRGKRRLTTHTSRRGEEKRNGASETEEEPCLAGFVLSPERSVTPRAPEAASHAQRAR